MKKLVILTNESMIGGLIKCGMAELVDGLANSLTGDYEVSVVCPDYNGFYSKIGSYVPQEKQNIKLFRLSRVDYCLVDKANWPSGAVDVINSLQPEIFHAFTQPEILEQLNKRPTKTIFTFEDIDYANKYINYISQYDTVTTISNAFAFGIKRMRSPLSSNLASANFQGVSTGIVDTVFSPQNGLLLASKFGPEDQSGKALCKKRMTEVYGIKKDKPIYLTMCRLVKEKGIESILSSIPTIQETNGILLVVGKGESQYEEAFRKFKYTDNVIFLDKWASPIQAIPLTAGADFFLQPSLSESAGLMPMTASRYGAIPITTLNGGLADNFNDENAIIVYDDLNEAIHQASILYNDKAALYEKRKICMSQDFSWTTRKQGYIDLYES